MSELSDNEMASQENEEGSGESANPEDVKAKFREALEKKKKSGGVRNSNTVGRSKVSGEQSGGGAPQMFRRKSGSA